MSLEQKPLAAEELLRAPDDGLRRELVRGEVRAITPAGSAHGRVAMNIGMPLGQRVRTQDLGVVYATETGFRISRDPDTVRAPDTAFVRKERVETFDSGEVVPGWTLPVADVFR